MPQNVRKAYAISDAKIMFVSLVDKAANQHDFLVVKSEDGTAKIQTMARIIKSDSEAHFVTGIVYEPMVEDSQGNYMTAEEIEKSCYWFLKNGGGNDLQHNFEPQQGVEVVESWIAKADFELAGEAIKKGTWLMTVEITDPAIFESIQKGDITGFSMGGTGVYSQVDVDISDPENPVEKATEESESKGLVKRLAKFFGLDVVEKGKVMDDYKRNSIRDNFWTAYYALSDYLLDAWNPETGRWEIQHDETIIREALDDFNKIVTELLTDSEPIIKTLTSEPIEKAGKKMSYENKKALKSIHDSLGEFLEKFEEEDEEVTDVNKAELEATVTAAVQKAMGAAQPQAAPTTEATPAENFELTPESIEKMVTEAVQKAQQAAQPQQEPITAENLQKAIDAAVQKAMEPVLKSTGVPSNLNDQQHVQKSENSHYMDGFFCV